MERFTSELSASGFIMFNLLFNFPFINSSTGDLPVMDSGVIQYWNKNVRNLSDMDSISFSFFIVTLNVLTAFSAHPLVAGWKGADLMCFISLVSQQKNANSSLVNTGPLSEIITCGYPWVVKQCCNALIVDLELVLFIVMTSKHFEKEFLIITNIFPWNESALSVLNLTRELFVLSQ